MDFTFGKEDGLSAQIDTLPGIAAVENTSSCRCLISNQIILAQLFRPDRNHMAMTAPTDRVFRHLALWDKAACHAVKIAALNRYMQAMPIQLTYKFLIRFQLAKLLFCL